MKTVADLRAELGILEQELETVTSLSYRIDDLGKRVQHATSGNLLGKVTTESLRQAQNDLDEAVAGFGKQIEIVLEKDGSATVVEGWNNSRLKVSFFWPFKADYWVIGLDPDYRWAVVGNPNRKY